MISLLMSLKKKKELPLEALVINIVIVDSFVANIFRNISRLSYVHSVEFYYVSSINNYLLKE